MSAHKFKFGTDGGYRTMVYCEYCGHVSFYCNQNKANDERQATAKEPCPQAPQIDDALVKQMMEFLK